MEFDPDAFLWRRSAEMRRTGQVPWAPWISFRWFPVVDKREHKRERGPEREVVGTKRKRREKEMARALVGEVAGGRCRGSYMELLLHRDGEEARPRAFGRWRRQTRPWAAARCGFARHENGGDGGGWI